ncbi:hypothetical protein FB157_11554 [Streptomyces sp. BK340]|nr:hypothetical protein FB157_11554 [Streptomyces sp. BK340]
MTAPLLLASTRKELFLAHRRDGAGEFEEPHFPGQAVYAEAIHAWHSGGPRLLASGDSAHWGPASSTPTASAPAGRSPNGPPCASRRGPGSRSSGCDS